MMIELAAARSGGATGAERVGWLIVSSLLHQDGRDHLAERADVARPRAAAAADHERAAAKPGRRVCREPLGGLFVVVPPSRPVEIGIAGVRIATDWRAGGPGHRFETMLG